MSTSFDKILELLHSTAEQLEEPADTSITLSLNSTSPETSEQLNLAAVEPVTSPDYLKRLGGAVLIFTGILGCILTAPLLLTGALAGLLYGVILQKDFYFSILSGASIGSLGFTFLVLFGISLSKATMESTELVETPTPLHVQADEPKIVDTPPIVEQVEQVEPDLTPNSTTPLFSQQRASEYRTIGSVNFNDANELQQFIQFINQRIKIEKEQVKPMPAEPKLSNVAEGYINTLIEVTKDSNLEPSQFWGRLDQMTTYDMQLFARRLNSDKTGRPSDWSELDYLWKHFKNTEFEPSRRRIKINYFTTLFAALSEKQLKATLSSNTFKLVINQEAYLSAAANQLNSTQLSWIAENSELNEILLPMIPKFQGPLLLGRLMAIIPHYPFTTREQNVLIPAKNALMEQLCHLLGEYPSVKVQLTKLLNYYSWLNLKKSQALLQEEQHETGCKLQN